MSAPVHIYLGLGTNLGDRAANLGKVWEALPPQVQPLRASRIYKTSPWGFSDQPDFLNQVFEAQTLLAPLELLACVKQIEIRLGRIPTFRNGPRLIDIDILFYGGQVLDLPGLTLPHPRMHKRAFMLIPLCDLAPDLVHPGLGLSLRRLAEQVDPTGVEVYLGG
jgi:2-amino-4-hydroxy-6-hydroxymethyldihydropteridine diphosphokinase